ncbi:MAG: hypothetical protein ACRC6T_17320 [Sarcina sp.]
MTGDIFRSIVKSVNEVILDNSITSNFKIDFGDIPEDINGLIGLDLLIKLNIYIDFKNLELHTK